MLYRHTILILTICRSSKHIVYTILVGKRIAASATTQKMMTNMLNKWTLGLTQPQNLVQETRIAKTILSYLFTKKKKRDCQNIKETTQPLNGQRGTLSHMWLEKITHARGIDPWFHLTCTCRSLFTTKRKHIRVMGIVSRGILSISLHLLLFWLYD